MKNESLIIQNQIGALVVDLVEVKSFLRVSTSTDDTMITGFIAAATVLCGKYDEHNSFTKTISAFVLCKYKC